MITLVLIDLDNLVWDEGCMPDVAAVRATLAAALPEPERDRDPREAVVVIGLNDATASAAGVTWPAVRSLAVEVATTVEHGLSGAEPSSVHVEPALMPRMPESADGALARLVARAAAPAGGGAVTDVVLLGFDRGLQREIQRELPQSHKRTAEGLAWWALHRPLHREPAGAVAAAPETPLTAPTQVIETPAHAAWAAGRSAQLAPCGLTRAGRSILSRPWLRAQLSVTDRTTTGPARLHALLGGEPVPLAVAVDEVVDFQAEAPALPSGVVLENVGPGTVRARWDPDGAQVLGTRLPIGVLRQAETLPLGRSAGIRDGAVRRSLEGRALSDTGWSVAFHKKHRRFLCEAERQGAWPALWWDRRPPHGGVTAKLAGSAVSTPRRIAGVPVRLRVHQGRLTVLSATEGGRVSVVRGGRRGELVEASAPEGRCVVLCTADVWQPRPVDCVRVQDMDVAELAGRLGADAGWLEGQGVTALPILVPSVRRGRRRASRGKDR